jgi:FG-GAP repeat
MASELTGRPVDTLGNSVAGAGDVNGDGKADVLVGAPLADTNGRENSGSAYVVFGKSDTATVEVAALGAGGFPREQERGSVAYSPGGATGKQSN